ncbi:MAG TPA: hypothetical protein VG960_12840 [Caulobacteraceae bacterium]|nr:hypothetical protein [Caulobacteraceae bacterium]
MTAKALILSVVALAACAGGARAQSPDPTYVQQQQDYQNKQQQYQDAQAQYEHQQTVYRHRLAGYERARAAYDADHGEGAFYRYYSVHPREYDALYGAGAYGRDFEP